MALRLKVICVCLTFVSVQTKPRVFDKDLSDEKHNILNPEKDSIEHNPNYDHEAFLGQQQAKVFDNLTPEKSRQKLLLLVNEKIDLDKDGKVSESELKAWISKTSKRYLFENRDNQWKSFGMNNDSLLDWQTYVSVNYGNDTDFTNSSRDPGLKAIQQFLIRDRLRWEMADLNNDDKLDIDEFLAILHPEEVERMHPLVVNETIKDMDKNHDGKVDLKEYITDLWIPERPDDPEPKWVEKERDYFNGKRDLNNDGFLDADEVKKWILPDDYDHVNSETVHLISNSDDDKDGYLSKFEILEHYDLFVGSQVTNFGEALTKHDEF